MRTLAHIRRGFGTLRAGHTTWMMAALFVLGLQVRAEDFNILMIGNSYTSGVGASGAGNPSADLQGLFNADPNHSATVTHYSVSGGTLRGRVNDAAVTGPTGLIHNHSNEWDVIILQERSDRPALAMKFGGSNLSGLDTGGPILIGNHIQASQPEAEVVLFNTWARYPGNQDLIDDFNNDPVEMQTLTNQGYERIRENSTQWDHSEVTSIARIGDAWQDWYDTYTYSESALRLHRPDGSHQNILGAYLAGAVLFEQITGNSTIGNAYVGNVSGSFDNEPIVSLLQQQATSITGAQIPILGDFDHDFDVDGADFGKWQLGTSPDPMSISDLDDWKTHYGSTNSLSIASTIVPEASSLALLFAAAISLEATRSRNVRSRQ